MTAARTGNPDAVGVLLMAGADTDATDAAGQTALMWAAAANNPSAIAALVVLVAPTFVRTEAVSTP